MFGRPKRERALNSQNMPTIGHLAVGLAVSRAAERRGTRMAGVIALFVGAAYLPDVDGIGTFFGVPYGGTFGHRGAFHSLTFAAVCMLLAYAVPRSPARGRVVMSLAVGAVVASHGILDAFTDGGMGVALLWPLSSSRYFAPWRPLPIAAFGLKEAVIFLPLFLITLWPRREGTSGAAEQGDEADEAW